MSETSETVLRMTGVSKSYGEIQAVKDFGLTVSRGEIVCLVGPSGCGKTTTLRLIAGFEEADSGGVDLSAGDDAAVRIGLVFQDGALFPHLAVAENVGFGLHRLPTDERSARVTEMLEMVGLPEMGSRRPHELSGGEQQRVALARALAPSPALLLLDEPLSHLDPHLAGQLGDEILEIIQRSGAAAIWVTHDQQEGLSVADRVVLMESGEVRQMGTPEELWRHPADAWVAEFLGYGDILEGVVKGGRLSTALGDVRAPQIPDGRVAKVLIRPEDVEIGHGGASGVVIRRLFRGADIIYYLRLPDGSRVKSIQGPESEIAKGATVKLSLRSGDLPVFAD